jgi:hypothetical protein
MSETGEIGTVEGVVEPRSIRIATWNMDHWKRSPKVRREGWAFLKDGIGADAALLQECVPGDGFAPPRIVYREIGGNRAWGNAVVALREGFTVEEVGSVRTRYGAARFHMLGTYPGTIIVARLSLPDLDPITCVSVYGMIDVYAQTTMFRIVADLIPLFDSPYGDRVVLGGDFNITTATSQGAPEFKRYDAILRAVESLGLRNVVETAAVRPPQLEACACGASACHHLWTFGGPPGSQLDWLFATPELAHRCRLLEVERAGSSELSDHAPVIADFDLPPSTPDREWDPASFVAEVGARHGDPAGRIAEEIVAWAERKHHSLQRHGYPIAALDRLPTSTGADPELWVQVDLRRPEGLAYTISITAKGRVVVQFQHMRAPPFETPDKRRPLWSASNQLPAVELPEKLHGRPSFPIEALVHDDNLPRFLRILDEVVEAVIQSHEKESG